MNTKAHGIIGTHETHENRQAERDETRIQTLREQQQSLDELAAIKDPHEAYRSLVRELHDWFSTEHAMTARSLDSNPLDTAVPTVTHDGRADDGLLKCISVRRSLPMNTLLKFGIVGVAITIALFATPRVFGDPLTDAITPMSSPVGGAREFGGLVRAGGSSLTVVALRGGEQTEIWMLGDGRADLDLYLVDAYGHIVDSDTSYGPGGYVSTTPRFAGTYTIVVRNLGTRDSWVSIRAE